MNFEQLYKKYKDGSATDEEKSYVEKEIENAKKVSAILEKEDGQQIPLKDAETKTIQQARRAFNLRTTIKTCIIVCVILVILATVLCGTFFTVAYVSANNNRTVSEEDAISEATALLSEHLHDIPQTEMIVRNTETELDIGSKLTDSIYRYEIHIIAGEYRYEISVSSKTGYAVITDKEIIGKRKR